MQHHKFRPGQHNPATKPKHKAKKTKRSQTLLLTNARSLLPKIAELQMILNSSSTTPDIIAITETWLTPSIPDSALKLPDYTIFRRDRGDQRCGGGVAVYVRDTLRCKTRTDLQQWTEDLWLELTEYSPKRRSLLFGCYYRPPSSDLSAFTVALETSLHDIDFNNHDVILAGDFNATSPTWSPTDSFNPAGSILEPVFLHLGLTQFVDQPTHVRPNAGNICGSTLDLILSSSPTLVSLVECLPPLGRSDHCVLKASFNFQLSTPPRKIRLRRIWAYDKVDIGSLNNCLQTADWTSLSSAPTIDSAWSAWKSVFWDLVHTHVPSKLLARPRAQAPWMTDVLRGLIKEKRTAFRAFKASPSAELRTRFCEIRNMVTSRLRKAERQYAQSLHRKNKLCETPSSARQFWQFVNNHLGRTKSSVIPDLVQTTLPDRAAQQRCVASDAEKAKLLNEFFVSQTILPDSTKLVPTISQQNSKSFSRLHTTPSDVYDILNTLKTTKSAGCDDIPPRLLRICAGGISSSLASLFNRSFSESKVPAEWKKARVVPVFKRGDKSLPTNYRPISLLCVISKVQERIVYNKVLRFLNPFLSVKQSGFRKADGAELQLLRLVQQWSEILDKSCYVGAVFFDLRKAFDKVWHDGLLAKLKAAGVSGKAFDWFTDFLVNRMQCTMVGREMSRDLALHAGVPQGAILSPLLFLIYVNDFPHAVQAGNSNLFADDTSLFVSSNDSAILERRLQDAIDQAANWFHKWLVSVNTTKSAVLVFRTRKMRFVPVAVHIDSQPIPQQNSHRHLGLELDEFINWNSHTAVLVRKLSSKLGLLFRVRKRLSGTIIRDIYLTCLLPSLEYGSLVWSGMRKGNNVQLAKIHRRAARLICGLRPLDDIDEAILLSRAGLESLIARADVRLAKFAVRFLNGRVPNHMSEAMQHWQQSELSSRVLTLRQPPGSRLPRPSKNILRSSPLYQAFSLWNSLPLDIRSCSFSELKNYLISRSSS